MVLFWYGIALVLSCGDFEGSFPNSHITGSFHCNWSEFQLIQAECESWGLFNPLLTEWFFCWPVQVEFTHVQNYSSALLLRGPSKALLSSLWLLSSVPCPSFSSLSPPSVMAEGFPWLLFLVLWFWNHLPASSKVEQLLQRLFIWSSRGESSLMLPACLNPVLSLVLSGFLVVYCRTVLIAEAETKFLITILNECESYCLSTNIPECLLFHWNVWFGNYLPSLFTVF